MKQIGGILGLLFKCYIAVIFAVTLLLYYLPIVLLKSFKATKKLTFKVFVCWSWSVRILSFIHVKYRLKSPPPEGPYIIVSNHISYFDIFLMYSILPKHPFLFLGKSEILSYPLVRDFFKNLNIPVDRSDRRKAAQAFIEAKRAVKQGWSLVIFPEGGIPDDNLPTMIAFKEGAFRLAQTTGVPIVPITFTNNHRLFSDPGKFLGPARPGLSHVFIHPSISAKQVVELDTKALSQLVFDIINEPLLSKTQK